MHQVKRFDKHGNLIEVISSEKLSHNHWTDFHKAKAKNKREAVTIPGSDPNKRHEPKEVL